MTRTANGAVSLSILLALVLAACGGDSLSRPESLPLHTYPADRAFRMSFVMTSCSDPCSDYGASECSVDVDTEERVIEVDVSVDYGERDGVDRATCALTCGAPVIGHCDVPAIPAGTYAVRADAFTGSIDVR